MGDAAIDAEEMAAWLRLVGTPGVGPASCRALLAAFGLPRAVFSASRDRLLRVVSSGVAEALQRPLDDAQRADAARTYAWSQHPDHHFLTLADPRYPRALLEIADPPPVLYVKGCLARFAQPGVAIVGSRNATPQGAIDARRFAQSLAEAGQTIISGLALGIDAAAHEGALAAGAGGASTIAVIGTGADVVYPARHRALAHRIAEQGALVSEFPLGTTAVAHHFPRRNRIIAGLARGVLVVEAAPQSGSLITARLAAEAGREVFAVPGSIHAPQSKGCHRLIRDGAKLVESVADVLEELRLPPASQVEAKTVDIDADADLLEQLGFDPLTVDELATRIGQPASSLASKLLDMELARRISRLPGGRVQRLIGD